MRLATLSAFALCLVLLVSGGAAAQVVDNLAHENALTRYKAGDDLFHDEMFARAAIEYKAAITFDPLLLIAYYQLGQSFMQLRQYQEAIQAYKAGKDSFQSMALMMSRSDVTLEQRRDDEIRELQDSIDQLQNARLPATYPREARIMQLQQRIVDLQRTRKAGPTALEPPAELSLALGSAYFRTGDLMSAEREWKEAVTVNNKLGEAHNNLAALYAQTGRKTDAQQAVKNAERAGYRVNPGLKADIQRLP
jgi:tetratricopeptide (TPR) repeat protein